MTRLSVSPNPFTDVATVMINSQVTDTVTVEMYDIHGRLIRSIYRGVVEAGNPKQFRILSGGLTSGLYIIQLATNTKVFIQKITLTK